MNNPRTYGSPPFRVAVVYGGPGAGGELAPVARHLGINRGVLEPIQTTYSLTEQITELCNILIKYSTPPVILIGHSWGAWLSIFVAVEYPGLVKKLVLVGSGTFEEKYVEQFRSTLNNHLTDVERGELASIRKLLTETTGEQKEKLFSRLGELSDKGYDFDPDFSDNLAGDLLTPNAEINQSVWAEAKAMRTEGSLLEYVKRIQCPLLAIHGDYDPHQYEGVRQPISKYVKDARFALLNKCGHSPWLEKHAKEEFYRILEEELIKSS